MIFFLLSISFRIHKLEKHETKDVSDSHINGSLTVVWRDWDKIIKHPQMVYVNFIDPKQVKGPHLHQNRTSYFYCISGEVVLIIKDENGKFWIFNGLNFITHGPKTNNLNPNSSLLVIFKN